MSYIKLDRRLTNWRYAHKPNYLATWVHILMKVNWQEREFEDTEIERGSFITSYENLANEIGISVHQVRTILGNLNGKELAIKPTNKYTKITVIKWEDYQCCDENVASNVASKWQTTDTQMAHKWQSSGNQVATTKEYKEIKKEIKKEIYKEKKSTYGKYGHVKLTDEQREKLEKELGNAMANECIQYLDNYCEGNGKTYKNYYQVIHNWVVSAVERTKTSQHFKEHQEYLSTDIKVDYTPNDQEIDTSDLDRFLNERSKNES